MLSACHNYLQLHRRQVLEVLLFQARELLQVYVQHNAKKTIFWCMKLSVHQ